MYVWLIIKTKETDILSHLLVLQLSQMLSEEQLHNLMSRSTRALTLLAGPSFLSFRCDFGRVVTETLPMASSMPRLAA